MIMNEMSENKAVSSEMQDDTSVIYLGDLWRGFLKYWWLCAAMAILLGGIMFYRNYIRFTPVYMSSATFTVRTQTAGAGSGLSTYPFYYDQATAAQLSSTFPYILQSNLLQEIVSSDLGLPYMPAALSASSVSGTNMFTITAVGGDPQLTYDTLTSAIQNYPQVAEYVIGNTELTMISAPEVAREPSNQLAWRRQTLIGILAGAAIGFVWIVLYAALRKTVRTKKDILTRLNQSCLGVLPDVVFKKYKRKINHSVLTVNPLVGSGFLEAVRVLRNTIIHTLGKDRRILMVTSTAPGEGKTTVTVNLALALAQAGKRVLLADADLRRPNVCPMLGISLERLTEIRKEASETCRREASIYYIKNLDISVMTFHTHSHRFYSLLRASSLKELFDPLREQYDYILIDTPPSGLISDAAIISQISDAAIFVIRQDTVRISRIRNTLDALSASNTDLIGCVLNGAASGVSGYGEHYGYHNGSYGRYKRYGRYGYGYGEKR